MKTIGLTGGIGSGKSTVAKMLEARARLNAITHPLISTAIRLRIGAERERGFSAPIVVEAAVLIEANWLSLVDEVWLVVASAEAVTERLGRQRGLSPDDVAQRIGAQLTDTERRRFADVVIENTGSIETLDARVEDAWRRATA